MSFKNAILIMTSNIGSQFVLEGLSGDDDPHQKNARREKVMDAVRAHFRPEFVNRVDEYIVFDPLDFGQVRKIVAQQVERVRARMADRKIGLHVGDDATQLLCEAGYDPAFGARPVKRAVQHLLETALAQAILRGDVGEDETAVVGVDASEGSGCSSRRFRRRFRRCRNRRHVRPVRRVRVHRAACAAGVLARDECAAVLTKASLFLERRRARNRVVSFLALPEDYGTAHIRSIRVLRVVVVCAVAARMSSVAHVDCTARRLYRT